MLHVSDPFTHRHGKKEIKFFEEKSGKMIVY
jgi:hypothetical protein